MWLFIHQIHHFLEVSTDDSVDDQSEIRTVCSLEIKCSYKHINIEPEEAAFSLRF